MTVAEVFPGQGAQRKGMGAGLFERYPALCRQADEILGYSVRDVCLDGAPPGLVDTRAVQPVLFVVGALAYLARREEHGPPAYLAGHSLGEYDALFAAGCFDFATGVRLVQRRGELMARASGGGMVAVVGAGPDDVSATLRRHGVDGVDLANRNSATQVVLSGPQDALEAAVAALRQEGTGRPVPLRVSAPFHSRYMAGAAREFAAFLDGVEFADPRIPVLANVTARPYPPGAVGELLARQVDSPVAWWETMGHLLELGVTEVVEVGSSDVLTKLWDEARRGPAPPAAPPGRAPRRPSRATPDTPRPPVRAQSGGRARALPPERLGSAEFRDDYGVRYAYMAGSMFGGIASAAMVVRMARAGLMGFFGAGGLDDRAVEEALAEVRAALGPDGRYGMNLLAAPDDPAAERRTVERYLRHDVRAIEAASFTQVTPALVLFRCKGARIGADGEPAGARHVVAKVSRPEVAAAFLRPPQPALLDALVAEGALTRAEAEAGARLPVSGDLCVEADSGGHTDAGSPYALMPAMTRLRDQAMAAHRYPSRVRVGAAGGIGSPESVAAAFVLGADFVITGSVNQCTPEAGTSDTVKDMLADLDVQDTAYAPAGDMFELGARVQVVRKGTLFPARANKLYQLYRQCASLDDVDRATRATIEQRYFRRSFGDVWDEARAHLLATGRADVAEQAEQDPKRKMARVFRWYFAHSNRVALAGVPDERVNYQIHCGPALGAFNRFVAGTPLVSWRTRHVDVVAGVLMDGAAELLDGRLHAWVGVPGAPACLGGGPDT